MALRALLLHVLLLRPRGGAVDGVRTGPVERRREGVLLAVTRKNYRGDVMSHNSDDGDDRRLGGLVTDDAGFTSWPTTSNTTASDDDVGGEGANWMSVDAAVVYPRTLTQLTLPGTHDSGAYRLGKQLLPDPRFPTPWAAAAIALAERLHVPIDRVITPWALTQTLDVAAQLRAGFRYVDLRAGWNGSHWCAHHAEVGPPVVTILRDVAEFVAEQPGEVLVVQVSHFDGFPTDEEVKALAGMVGEELRGVLVPLPPPPGEGGGSGGGEAAVGASGGGGRGGSFDVGGSAVRLHRTVGEMVESGERVLVTFGDSDYDRGASNRSRVQPPLSSSSTLIRSLLYPYSHLWPPWTLHNTYADTADPREMVRYNRQQLAAFGGTSAARESPSGGSGGGGVPGSLFKVSWTLTTQASTVLESVLPSHPTSLRQLNELGEPLLALFAEEAVAAGCRAGNILTVDFASTSDAVRAARAMNALPVGVNCTL